MSSWVEQVAEFRRALCLGLVREKGSLGRVRISELEYDVKVGREALKGEVAETVEAMSDLIFELTYRDWETDRKSTRLNSSHITRSRMPSSA